MQTAQQAQLMGSRGFAEREQCRQVADAHLTAGQRIENADAGRVTQDLEGFGQRFHGSRVQKSRALNLNI